MSNEYSERVRLALEMRDELISESGESEFKGKPGVWRRVANHNIFFPDDGSDPLGIPKPKDKGQEKKEVVKAKKKVQFFNKLFKVLKSKRSGQ